MTPPPVLRHLLIVVALLAVGCTAAEDPDPDPDAAPSTDSAATPDDGRTDDAAEARATAAPATPRPVPTFPPPPPVPDGPTAPDVAELMDRAVASPLNPDVEAIAALGDTGDPRVLWLLSDLLRLAASAEAADAAVQAANTLAGTSIVDPITSPWRTLTDHLIAWDLPAPDGYVARKATLFTALEAGWTPFFDDADAAIDWRLVSWGGVLIDDRPLGEPGPCPEGCIPALDDPELVPAEEGGWYPDDGIVFGITLGAESVALPRNQMEVHEMVNATIGGQRVAIPYCTLCGAAQAFRTDGTDIVMRTSGLLHRSNKVMYDLTTQSVFDTFTGTAVSGPLQDQQLTLAQVPVVTTTWAEWRAAHPDTTIIAADGGIGRSYDLDPLGGRDDDGPIFPVGERDERLDVHEPVLGIVLEDGTAVAFPVVSAQTALAAGQAVELDGVVVTADAGGLVATTADGAPLPSHQAFWFAWSQFHPDTLLWEPA